MVAGRKDARILRYTGAIRCVRGRGLDGQHQRIVEAASLSLELLRLEFGSANLVADGKKIAFASIPPNGTFVIDANGRGLRWLSGASAVELTWQRRS